MREHVSQMSTPPPGGRPPADAAPGREAAELHKRPRWQVALTVLVVLLSVGLLLWVAPPSQILRQIGEMNPAWVLAAVLLELGSCLSYVVVFRRFFPEPPRGVGRRVAWIAMGAGAVLPGGNISSAAATGWLLRKHGVGKWHLLERCGALLCLLTLFGFAVNGIAALLLLARVPDGPHDLLHTGGPIAVSLVVLGTAAAVMLGVRRLGDRAPRPLRALAAGLEGAWGEVGSAHWRLLGAAGFLCLDMAALWAACAATGHHIGFLAVLLAYCIGYLATLIPVPAGLGVLDSGLAGALVLYGLSPAASVSAVLVYHAISIWVPGMGGLLAWLPGRRERRSLRPPSIPAAQMPPVARPGRLPAPAETP
jgi:uncharacterized membrane protein YbhN (UPF0104 family)